MCDLYEIILIIIIISLGQILLSYISNTSRTHTRTHAHTHTRTHTHTHTRADTTIRLSLFDGSMAPDRDGVNAPFHRFGWRSGRCFIQLNTRAGHPVSRGFGYFSGIQKLLGRTDTRTRDVTGCVFCRYEQFETSPETIEQELRPAVC